MNMTILKLCIVGVLSTLPGKCLGYSVTVVNECNKDVKAKIHSTLLGCNLEFDIPAGKTVKKLGRDKHLLCVDACYDTFTITDKATGKKIAHEDLGTSSAGNPFSAAFHAVKHECEDRTIKIGYLEDQFGRKSNTCDVTYYTGIH
jgi:hypothetical protein